MEEAAHIGMWDAAMFGLNYPGQAIDETQNYNNNEPVQPLKQSDNLPISSWFAHGLLSYPPAPNTYLLLPSGSSFFGELQCNRQQTTLGDPSNLDPDQLREYACDQAEPPGALHNMNPLGADPDKGLFGGTCLAIAYESDERKVRPEDMTVISCNHTSPWWRVTEYKVPAGMPRCPEVGCLCTWNWVHQAAHGEGYGSEIYSILYRCKITGDTIDDANKVAFGQPPTLCADPGSEECASKPKAPIYIFQAEGNNMPNPSNSSDIPLYLDDWGFTDGAQTGIFTTTTSASPSTSSSFSPKRSSKRARRVVEVHSKVRVTF
ncbi:hypothetical protein IAT38_002793 [Cryptococcus sp. DSM 104549]